MPEIFIRLIEAHRLADGGAQALLPVPSSFNGGGPCGRPPFGHRSGEILSEKNRRRSWKNPAAGFSLPAARS